MTLTLESLKRIQAAGRLSPSLAERLAELEEHDAILTALDAERKARREAMELAATAPPPVRRMSAAPSAPDDFGIIACRDFRSRYSDGALTFSLPSGEAFDLYLRGPLGFLSASEWRKVKDWLYGEPTNADKRNCLDGYSTDGRVVLLAATSQEIGALGSLLDSRIRNRSKVSELFAEIVSATDSASFLRSWVASETNQERRALLIDRMTELGLEATA